jgi:chitin disaccharide deacetylase
MPTEQQRRWCLFTSAGDKNAIRLWLKGDTPRRWDLVVAYYGNDDHEFSEISKSSSYAFHTKGAKFQNLKKLVVQNPRFFDQYSYVWVCDDDIRMSAAQIDEAFAITEFFEFWVAQPALQGKIAHPITSYAGPQCDYRIVNFVEVGVAIFRRDKLAEFLTVYDGSLVGWGIDYWYMNFFKANEFGRFAIIDKVQVINPHDEEKGGREIDRLQPSSLRKAAWIDAMAKHGIVELPMRAFAYCRIASDRNAGADVTPPTNESIFPGTSAAVLTQARTLAERLGYDPHLRLLIVHADDLAVTSAVNEAFVNNFETGLINSGSVMVPGPWFPEVVAFARAHPEADIGLHLTLTSERTAYRWGPTAPRTEVPSLVDQQGYFHQTWTSETRVNSREVEVELRAQIEKAYAAGLRPTHLDSHQYRLQMSGRDLFELYLRLGREYDLPVFVARDWFTQFPYLQLSLTPRDVVIDHTVTIGPEIVPEQWPAYYRRALESLQPGVTEFVIHPGLDNAALQAFSADRPTWGAAWRQRDLDFFTSEEFRALLAKYDIRLITWREIGARLPEIERYPAGGWKGEYEEETLESKTRRLSAELEARTGEHEMLLARIAEHRGDNERLKAELANRIAESEQHLSKIQLVLGSTSWRLTEPLRFVGRRLHWLRRLTQKGR